MAQKSFRSLHRKIAISVLSVAISFAIIAALVSFMTELSRSRNKTEVMINQLLDTIEYTAAIASYSNNQQIALDVINGLLRNDIVHKVRIQTEQGLLLENERHTPGGLGFAITRKLSSPFDKQEIVGAITVDSEAYYSLEEAEHSAVMNAINSFLLIALTTGLILFVVRARLARPLTVVSDSLHAISAGEQNRLVPLLKNKDDELGRLVRDINKLLDVLETKFANEQTLREKIEHIEKKLRTIFESSSAGLFQLDHHGKLLTCNPTLTKVLNKHPLASDHIIGQDFAELFFEHPHHVQQMLHDALQSEQLETKDFLLQIAPGQEPLWIHCLLSKIADPDNQYHFEGVVFDITKRIVDEQAMRYQAEYDTLTGLLRRPVAEAKLKALLTSGFTFPVAILLLDMDGFKAINDTHGHDAGDLVLIEIAKRFKNNVRSNDIVARLGGDEFLIVLNKCETKHVEHTIAEKIIQAIQVPIALNAHTTVSIGVSIGIASYPLHGNDTASLLKAADEAMYEVKRRGKNGFMVKN
ncbi:diguanylate cyclase domain-containing protein [Crenothrix sp.]|uniref:diguanylate cyclase domain-containing protein n=1 Tax=Crenothrix sp. TaxID=3100433 RepID=UPI00374DE982